MKKKIYSLANIKNGEKTFRPEDVNDDLLRSFVIDKL